MIAPGFSPSANWRRLRAMLPHRGQTAGEREAQPHENESDRRAAPVDRLVAGQ